MVKDKGRFTITIDLEDEFQAYKRDEPDVSTPAAVLDLVDKGESAAHIGRYLIVARELDEAADILRPAKTQLLAAGAYDVTQFIIRQTKTFHFGSRDYEVRIYKAEGLGRPALPDEEDGEDEDWTPTGFVRTDRPEATGFAERHLDTVVMGHLLNHLAIIRVSQGNDVMMAKADSWFANARQKVSELAENGD